MPNATQSVVSGQYRTITNLPRDDEWQPCLRQLEFGRMCGVRQHAIALRTAGVSIAQSDHDPFEHAPSRNQCLASFVDVLPDS
jgi:hypothetical protein